MVKPHDLLKLSADTVLPTNTPRWVVGALTAAPWVVVRRARAAPGRVAVGVRGCTRSQRHALDVRRCDIAAVVTPEELAHSSASADRPAFRALDVIRPALDRVHISWGPTGSVGFELATGIRTVTQTSDLDLVVRLTGLCHIAAIERAITETGARIDCQVETAAGAIALTELTADTPEILVRTADGPWLMPRVMASL